VIVTQTAREGEEGHIYIAMSFGQIVVGPPGSGKTTYCLAMRQQLEALGRKVAVVSLDPANVLVLSCRALPPQLLCMPTLPSCACRMHLRWMDSVEVQPPRSVTWWCGVSDGVCACGLCRMGWSRTWTSVTSFGSPMQPTDLGWVRMAGSSSASSILRAILTG
jgi:hypothetical protein